MTATIRTTSPLSPEVIQPEERKGSGFLQRWNALTAIPEPLPTANFAAREAARKSQITSNVLFFFTFMVIFLLPVCYISPYPTYFWLDVGLTASCILALVLNRNGYTLAAGILVNVAGFAVLTSALFSTIPFDETTLQGYDMYVIIELLAVSLLPMRSVFLVLICSIGCILGTLLYMPHTAVLDKDLHDRFLIIAARPVGTLVLVAGVAYILSATMANAIRRAGQAEMIARLEHEMAEQKQSLEEGIQQILQAHVEISNGNLGARAPLTQNNVLWQISNALNNLLVRYQRAARAERELQRVEQAVTYYVGAIQQAERHQQAPVLPLGQTALDPLIVALQNKTVGQAQLPRASTGPHAEYIPFTPKG
jgi:uncharacterized membrane protein YgdD (TMEM256/DUF423 family)